MSLYNTDSLVIQKPSKKSKKGFTEVDLIPLIHSLKTGTGGSTRWCSALCWRPRIPGLNPELLITTARNIARCFGRILWSTSAGKC